MEPIGKDPAIRRLQSHIMGTDVPASIKADTCVSCKRPATEFNTALAAKEFSMSGLCQVCQDEVFRRPTVEEAELESLWDYIDPAAAPPGIDNWPARLQIAWLKRHQSVKPPETPKAAAPNQQTGEKRDVDLQS